MRPMRVRLMLLFAVVVVAVVAPVASAGAAPAPRYYLSLGDSVAAGWQPDENGVGHFTNEGYTDQLYRRMRDEIPGLQHIKLGCPGATTVTLADGGGYCPYPHGSQLDEAVAFLEAHPGEVAFVTIDIGANDVLACNLADPNVMACLQGKFVQIGTYLPQILGELMAAGGGQVPIIGMNYYNPQLAYWLEGVPPDGPAGPALAEQSNVLTMAFNGVLESVYGAFGVPVADVFAAFRTDRWHLTGGVPFNVFRICQFTWMCVEEPQGLDIHPNRRGHGVIATAFKQILGDLGV